MILIPMMWPGVSTPFGASGHLEEVAALVPAELQLKHLHDHQHHGFHREPASDRLHKPPNNYFFCFVLSCFCTIYPDGLWVISLRSGGQRQMTWWRPLLYESARWILVSSLIWFRHRSTAAPPPQSDPRWLNLHRFSLFGRSTVVIAVWRVVHNISTITSKECWAECCRRAKSVRGTILHCGNRSLVPARTRWHQTRICDVRSSSAMSSPFLSSMSHQYHPLVIL